MERGGRKGRRLTLALACALAALAAACGVASADFPYPSSGDPSNPSTYKLAPGATPNDFGEGDWKLAATPDTSPQGAAVNNKQDELCGVRGSSVVDTATTQPTGCLAGQPVHTAFEVTTGRPDVTIAVLDSGIRWNDQGAMTDLRDKIHLNRGELPTPQHDLSNGQALMAGAKCNQYADAYDANGDGVFNLADYACDSRVATAMSSPLRHGPNGFLTPEDLIIAFSNGTDEDHNGFVDDIAGWNFVDDNNDPFDDVQYRHGTGEATDSTAEANNGGDLGSCPNCMVLPLRVGESFIADANRFAQAVVYGTDMGIDVVQEALGTLNQSMFARQAIDYAYSHGVTVIASAADEAAEHHNQPGSLPHTVVVNSVTQYDSNFTFQPPSYLQFNGCTNFSTRVTVAVESGSCSSEATGKSSGIAGLIYSAAESAIDQHHLTPSGDCTRVDGSPCPITPNEVRQLMGSGRVGGTAPADTGGGQSDDVNFAQQPESSCAQSPQPICTDPNKNTTFATDQMGGAVGPTPHTTRYPARKGFDEFYGYGRLNAYTATSAAEAGNIPPEADITSPDWFQQLDPSHPIELAGYVNARLPYTCKVYVAPGGEPNNDATTDNPAGDFEQVASPYCDGTTTHDKSFRGALASIDPTHLESRFPPGQPSSFDGNENGSSAQTSNGRPNTMPYAFTVRVVVSTAASGPAPAMSGEDRRQLFLHRDKDILPHFPMELRTDGASSPLLVDLDGDNRNELVVATSDGEVHAFRPDGSELPGWPVHTDSLPLHTGERAYTASDGVGGTHDTAVLGALAAGDLFHDGRLEIVADDNQGNVYAWDSSGHRVFHEQSNPNWSGAPLTPFHTVRNGVRDRTERGFLSSPVLGDLDGHGLDIIAAGEDRHVYAWHADGSPVAGFPVLVVDPDKVQSVDPTTNHVTFRNVENDNTDLSEDQGKIIDTPALADLDGSHHPSIVIGTNEEYQANTGDEGGMNASGVNAASLGLLGQTGQLKFGNSRAYVIKNDGKIAAGWPKKIGLINAGLLPDVGEGVNGSPVVAPLTCQSGGSGMKIAVTPDGGPGYVFNPDGSSCYGTGPDGKDKTLQTDFSAGPGQYDHPAFPAVGYPTFGTLDGSTTSLFSPVAGLIRALDLAINEYQGGQDFIGGWDPSSGQFLTPGYPTPVNDLQFLTGPVVGDVLGHSGQEVIGGTASLDLAAVDASGAPASSAWPKLTGDWTVATPALGSFGTLDTDSSAKKDVVSITRMGTLSAYTTPAGACSPSSSPRFHHDNANSGDYTRDAVPPGVPMNAAASGTTLTFKAPGDDLLCGTVNHYEVVTSNDPITAENFAMASTVQFTAPSSLAAAGGSETLTLQGTLDRYVAVRAVDDQGNLGLPAVVDRTGSGAGTSVGGQAGTPGVGGSNRPSTPTSCTPPARLKLGFGHGRGVRVVRAVGYVNGHRRISRRGRNLKSLTFTGLPRGTLVIRIVTTESSGNQRVTTRTYVNCRKTRTTIRVHHRRHRKRRL